jgi:hypothetical protein
MNILIKLTCLVGLTIAPILGGHRDGANSTGGINMQIRNERIAPGSNYQGLGAPPAGAPGSASMRGVVGQPGDNGTNSATIPAGVGRGQGKQVISSPTAPGTRPPNMTEAERQEMQKKADEMNAKIRNKASGGH